MVFVNISNHPIDKWNYKQRKQAEYLSKDGILIDIPFPHIDPNWNDEETRDKAYEFIDNEIVPRIFEGKEEDLHKTVVYHIMGEQSFSYYLIDELLMSGEVVVSTTERKIHELAKEDGSKVKISTFEFIRFRRILI